MSFPSSRHIAAAVRKTRDHRPRRSRQSRSTRPRAEVRVYHRTHTGGIPNECRSYIIERRGGQSILIGEAVYREYVNRRKQRVVRAEEEVARAKHMREYARGARRRNIHRHTSTMVMAKAALADAMWERDNAKRAVDRPTGELVTVPVVSIYAARRWPNALPGGTSRQRASRIVWAIKCAQDDDAREDAWFCQRYAG